MANKLYGSFKDKLVRQQFASLDTYQYRVVLLDATYVFDDTHSTINDIPPASIVSEAIIQNTYLVGHTLDGDNTLFPSVVGPEITQFVIYIYNVDSTLTHLVAHVDTGNGLPITPNNDSIIILWSDSPYKIFTL